MKAFFLKLQGDDKGSAKMLEQVQGTIYDVQILKDMFTKIELSARRATVVYKEPNLVRIKTSTM